MQLLPGKDQIRRELSEKAVSGWKLTKMGHTVGHGAVVNAVRVSYRQQQPKRLGNLSDPASGGRCSYVFNIGYRVIADWSFH